jgi:uncharacterized protein YgiM (DUF1202 family)
MTRRNLAEEWKLEESGDERDEWKLEPAEQNAASQWQLRDAEQIATEWQPIDYQRERSSSGGNWVLPSLVGVALVAVIAYAAWIGLNRMGLLGTTAPPSVEPTEAAAVVETPVEPAATTAPTETPASPSPTPEPSPTPPPEPSPTPIPVLALQSATVNAVGGVNARREPNTTAEVIRILPQGERFLVIEDRTDWVQLAIGGGEVGWVAGEFVDRTSETVTYDVANQRRAQVGLPALAPPAAPAETTALTGTTPVTEAVTITETDPVTTGAAPPEAAPVTAAISATVNITVGLNSREEPNTTAPIVQLLAASSSYSAIARSADNQWVQLVLPDGSLAWAFAEFLALSGDIATLPVGPLAAPPAPAASPSLTGTTNVTSSAPVTGVIQVVSGVTASVTSLSGTDVRATPDLEGESLQLLPFDAVLPVIGRSADSQWIQVALEEGRVAWAPANTVSVNTDVTTLPVVNP